MRVRSGFTVIELVVVMMVMAILLTVGMVSLLTTQRNGRDAERDADIKQVMVGLERYYNDTGKYPDTAMVANVASSNPLPDTNLSDYTYSWLSSPAFRVATSTPAGGQATVDTYVYEPLSYNGSAWVLCTSGLECMRYTIHFVYEKSSGTTQSLKGKRE